MKQEEIKYFTKRIQPVSGIVRQKHNKYKYGALDFVLAEINSGMTKLSTLNEALGTASKNIKIYQNLSRDEIFGEFDGIKEKSDKLTDEIKAAIELYEALLKLPEYSDVRVERLDAVHSTKVLVLVQNKAKSLLKQLKTLIMPIYQQPSISIDTQIINC